MKHSLVFSRSGIYAAYMYDIDTLPTLSQLIKRRRKALGLKQADAALLCGVGTRFFSDLENSKPTLEIDKVLRVVTLLGMDLHLSVRDDRMDMEAQ